jgi:hypothetical protein
MGTDRGDEDGAAVGGEQIRQRRQGRKEIEEKDEQISPRTFA